MVKLGIIGLGKMGGYHASACNLIPSVSLIGVADPNPALWEKVKSTKVIKSKDYRDWIDLVDGVIIATPTDLHYPIAKEILSLGKHVLIEKPLTKQIDHAKELFDIAAQKKCALHIGHVERFNGAVQELKKIIHEPYLIESYRMGPFASRVQNDTVVLDLMIHDLDIILGIVNSPIKSISTVGNKIKSDKCDIAVVHIAFENGTLANIISSRASHIKKRTMSIHQQNEFIELNFTSQDISIHKHTSESVQVGHNQLQYKQEETVERLFVYKDNPLKLEIEHFASSIKSGKNLIDPEQDLSSLQITLDLEKKVEEIISNG
jgi:predicted dehydrogenase